VTSRVSAQAGEKLQGAIQLLARGALELKGKEEMQTFLPTDAKGIPNG